STSRISTSCWEFTWSSAPSRSVPPRAQALLQHSITTYAGPRERGVRALRRHAPSRCRPQPLELGLHVLLVAVRADAVAEVGGGALLDVALDRLPLLGRIADPLAVGANREQSFELLHMPPETEDAVGHLEARVQLVDIHGLGDE